MNYGSLLNNQDWKVRSFFFMAQLALHSGLISKHQIRSHLIPNDCPFTQNWSVSGFFWVIFDWVESFIPIRGWKALTTNFQTWSSNETRVFSGCSQAFEHMTWFIFFWVISYNMFYSTMGFITIFWGRCFFFCESILAANHLRGAFVLQKKHSSRLVLNGSNC